jgi:LacI family transcriptional regulator
MLEAVDVDISSDYAKLRLVKKRGSSRASLGDVAKAAGISKTAVSYALRDCPNVSRETRERIHQIARRLGYVPDARLASWMARVKKAESKEVLPLAWINSQLEEDAWHRYKFLLPYLEGARTRALELGYRLEEIWTRQPGMSMRRISQMIYQRGVEGVIVSQPVRHLRLHWNNLAVVSIDGSLLVPSFHRVMSDNAYNLWLALKSLRQLGYRRIGICLSEPVDNYSHHMCRGAAAHYFHSMAFKSERIPPLFYPEEVGKPQKPFQQIVTWLRHNRPHAVIGLNSHLVEWIEATGLRVPRDIGVVHLALDDDVVEWAGIYSNKREIGAIAAEWVISFLQHHRFGLPKVATNQLIRGEWRPGCTLLTPQAQE